VIGGFQINSKNQFLKVCKLLPELAHKKRFERQQGGARTVLIRATKEQIPYHIQIKTFPYLRLQCKQHNASIFQKCPGFSYPGCKLVGAISDSLIFQKKISEQGLTNDDLRSI
jgi:hypothetical protein